MLQRTVTVVCLTLVYAASLASLHPVDLGFGVVLAVVLTRRFGAFVFRAPPLPLRELHQRIAGVGPLIWAVLRSIAAGSWQVARAGLSRTPPARPGIIVVTLDGATPTGLMACALLVTLSPGSLAVDVDVERRAIRLHLLDAADPDAARRDIERFYHHYQRRVIA